MNTLKFAWKWLVYSSDNADKISRTVKGGLAAVLVAFTFFLGAGHLNIPILGTELNGLVDALIVLVQTLVAAISAAMTVIGVVRKIVTTIKGTNKVVNAEVVNTEE